MRALLTFKRRQMIASGSGFGLYRHSDDKHIPMRHSVTKPFLAVSKIFQSRRGPAVICV
jgi:hypothetical protein